MKLCLSCFRFSPSNAIYCGHCGRTFGSRLCRTNKEHRSPFDAQVCVQCGTDDLTAPTFYLPFGWMSRILAWGAIFLMLQWAVPQGAWLAQNFGVNMLRRLGIVTHPLVILDCLLRWLITLGFFYGLIVLLLSLLPGEAGNQLRLLLSSASSTLGVMLRTIFSALFASLRFLSGLLIHLAEGNKSRRK